MPAGPAAAPSGQNAPATRRAHTTKGMSSGFASGTLLRYTGKTLWHTGSHTHLALPKVQHWFHADMRNERTEEVTVAVKVPAAALVQASFPGRSDNPADGSRAGPHGSSTAAQDTPAAAAGCRPGGSGSGHVAGEDIPMVVVSVFRAQLRLAPLTHKGPSKCVLLDQTSALHGWELWRLLQVEKVGGVSLVHKRYHRLPARQPVQLWVFAYCSCLALHFQSYHCLHAVLYVSCYATCVTCMQC
jgi:hypothetical protein